MLRLFTKYGLDAVLVDHISSLSPFQVVGYSITTLFIITLLAIGILSVLYRSGLFSLHSPLDGWISSLPPWVSYVSLIAGGVLVFGLISLFLEICRKKKQTYQNLKVFLRVNVRSLVESIEFYKQDAGNVVAEENYKVNPPGISVLITKNAAEKIKVHLFATEEARGKYLATLPIWSS